MKKADKKNKVKETKESGPIFDMRIALVVVFLLAASMAYLLEASPWTTLAAGGLAGAAWALFKERRLTLELLSGWRNVWMLTGPVIAVALYAFLEIIIQLASDMALRSGGIDPSNPPTIFAWLLELRAHWSGLNPAVAGIAGGLFLGISEEIFWRGFIQTRLMMATSFGVAVLLTSVLYGVYYFFILGPLAALWAGFFGMVLAMMVLRSRSILPAILTHTLFLFLTLWLRPDIGGIL